MPSQVSKILLQPLLVVRGGQKRCQWSAPASEAAIPTGHSVVDLSVQEAFWIAGSWALCDQTSHV